MLPRRLISRLPRTAWLAILTVAAAISASSGPVAAQEARYNRDVLPILAENCFACHGFDKAKRKAGLRLDSAVGATAELESGARAIVPGKLTESALIERIFTADSDDLMPPKKTGRHLTDAQKATLRNWIEQ